MSRLAKEIVELLGGFQVEPLHLHEHVFLEQFPSKLRTRSFPGCASVTKPNPGQSLVPVTVLVCSAVSGLLLCVELGS